MAARLPAGRASGARDVTGWRVSEKGVSLRHTRGLGSGRWLIRRTTAEPFISPGISKSAETAARSQDHSRTRPVRTLLTQIRPGRIRLVRISPARRRPDRPRTHPTDSRRLQNLASCIMNLPSRPRSPTSARMSRTPTPGRSSRPARCTGRAPYSKPRGTGFTSARRPLTWDNGHVPAPQRTARIEDKIRDPPRKGRRPKAHPSPPSCAQPSRATPTAS